MAKDCFTIYTKQNIKYRYHQLEKLILPKCYRMKLINDDATFVTNDSRKYVIIRDPICKDVLLHTYYFYYFAALPKII